MTLYAYSRNVANLKCLKETMLRYRLEVLDEEIIAFARPALSVRTLPPHILSEIRDNIGERQLVTWGRSDSAEADILESLGIPVSGRVYWNMDLVKGSGVHHFSWINDKRGAVFLICWDVRMDDKLSEYFSKINFKEREDFMLISTKGYGFSDYPDISVGERRAAVPRTP